MQVYVGLTELGGLSTNELNVLILRWATVSAFSSRCGTSISVCNQPPRSTQPGHPFVGRHSEYRPQGGDACDWGVKAGMVRVWAAGKSETV